MIEKERSQERRSLLGLKDTLDGLARASGVRWYAHVWKKDNGDVLRKALNFEVAERRGRGRPNMTWKRQGASRSHWTEKGRCHRQGKVA